MVQCSECVNTDRSPVLLCGPFCLLAPGFTASWFPCLRQASAVRRLPRALGLVSTCQTPDMGASDPRSTPNLSGKVSDTLGMASPGVMQSWQRPNINSVMASWSKECSGKYLVLLFIRTLGFKLIAKHVRLPFHYFFNPQKAKWWKGPHVNWPINNLCLEMPKAWLGLCHGFTDGTDFSVMLIG